MTTSRPDLFRGITFDPELFPTWKFKGYLIWTLSITLIFFIKIELRGQVIPGGQKKSGKRQVMTLTFFSGSQNVLEISEVFPNFDFLSTIFEI